MHVHGEACAQKWVPGAINRRRRRNKIGEGNGCARVVLGSTKFVSRRVRCLLGWFGQRALGLALYI